MNTENKKTQPEREDFSQDLKAYVERSQQPNSLENALAKVFVETFPEIGGIPFVWMNNITGLLIFDGESKRIYTPQNAKSIIDELGAERVVKQLSTIPVVVKTHKTNVKVNPSDEFDSEEYFEPLKEWFEELITSSKKQWSGICVYKIHRAFTGYLLVQFKEIEL